MSGQDPYPGRLLHSLLFHSSHYFPALAPRMGHTQAEISLPQLGQMVTSRHPEASAHSSHTGSSAVPSPTGPATLTFSRWALMVNKRLPGASLLCATSSHSRCLLKMVTAVIMASLVIIITATGLRGSSGCLHMRANPGKHIF